MEYVCIRAFYLKAKLIDPDVTPPSTFSKKVIGWKSVNKPQPFSDYALLLCKSNLCYIFFIKIHLVNSSASSFDCWELSTLNIHSKLKTGFPPLLWSLLWINESLHNKEYNVITIRQLHPTSSHTCPNEKVRTQCVQHILGYHGPLSPDKIGPNSWFDDYFGR